MIKSLNVSLTSRCSAQCIFCPTDRGECNEKILMESDTFDTIIEHINNNETEQIVIGENGDAFIHPKIMTYLHTIKHISPNTKIVLFTNFQTSTEAQWQEIIEHQLVDKVITNIDSINPERYEQTKNADFFKMWQNFTAFLQYRIIHDKQHEIPIEVNILDPKTYKDTFKEVTHKDILPEITGPDTTELTMKFIKFLLTQHDVVQSVLPCFWAERHRFGKHANLNDKCPQLSRVETEAFIASDGTWYACCLDSKNELRLGNINEQSLADIAKGEKRQILLKQLRNKQFEQIGSPCNTVDCCHTYKMGGNQNE